jgi:hypothetical protein
MLALTEEWPEALLKLVEDTANGPAIISTLQDKMPGIVAVPPQDSKMARCASVSAAIEAGNVCVPDARFIVGAEWVEDFMLEFSRFPRGSHDDQVDAATQALGRLVRATRAANASIGIIKGRIGREVCRASNLPNARSASAFGGSNLPNPGGASARGGSNLPDPYGRRSGGSSRPGGAPPGKPHHIF